MGYFPNKKTGPREVLFKSLSLGAIASQPLMPQSYNFFSSKKIFFKKFSQM